MTQLHILVVVDVETGAFHIGGMDEAPVDSSQTVWDDPEWRQPTDAERELLIDAEGRLSALINPQEVPS